MLKNKQLTIRVSDFCIKSLLKGWNQAADSFPVAIRVCKLTWSFGIMNGRTTEEQVILSAWVINLDFDAEFLQRKRKSSRSWETIGAKRILFYSWSCTKAFASSSRKNSLNDLGDNLHYSFAASTMAKLRLRYLKKSIKSFFTLILKLSKLCHF